MSHLRTKGCGVATAAIAAIVCTGPVWAQQTRKAPPGEGVYCALAIYSVANQVAAVCRPDEAPELRGELQSAVDRLGAYVVKNGGVSTADVEQFKQKQGGVGAPKEQLCQGDALTIYDALRNSGPQMLRKIVDEAVARPGKPTWGSCL